MKNGQMRRYAEKKGESRGKRKKKETEKSNTIETIVG
jgi:hypothetical protein